MTVGSTSVVTAGSNTNGATTQFSFSFRIQAYGGVEAEDQLRVKLVEVASGTETVLARGGGAGQYSVSINGDQDAVPGGSITTVTTYPSGYKIYIELSPSFLQATDYVNQGGFLAQTVEAQHDQQQMQINVLRDRIRRSPYISPVSGVGFNGEIEGTPSAGFAPTLKDDLSGFRWGVPGVTTFTADGTTQPVEITYWAALNGIWPEQFGESVGTGGDDFAALTAWANAVKASAARRGLMQFKRYKTSGRLPDIDVPGVTILGCGPSRRHYDEVIIGTIIEPTAALPLVWRIGPQASGRNLEGITVKGITIDCSSLAEQAWQVQSISNSNLDISQFESTVLGGEFGVVDAFDEPDVRDCQDNDIRFYSVQISNAAPGWLTTGDTGANFSLNRCDFHGIHNDEVAGYHESSDNNKWRVRTYGVPGGAAVNSIVWRGSDEGDAGACRHEWYGLLSVNLPCLAEGTATWTYPPHTITIDDPDFGNGSPLPTVEAGAYDIRVPGEQGTSIAAAASADLGRCVGDVVLITGSGASITGLGTARAGRIVECVFDDANTLTHHGTSLICPGNANIATAAGDSMQALSLGSGNWRVTRYIRAAQRPYAEGTYTPAVSFSTPGDAAFTYSAQAGNYARYGNIVFFAARVTFTVTHTTAAGVAQISVPFPSASGVEQAGITIINSNNVAVGSGEEFLAGALAAGGANAAMTRRNLASAVVSVLSPSNFPSGATAYTVRYSGTYIAAP